MHKKAFCPVQFACHGEEDKASCDLRRHYAMSYQLSINLVLFLPERYPWSALPGWPFAKHLPKKAICPYVLHLRRHRWHVGKPPSQYRAESIFDDMKHSSPLPNIDFSPLMKTHPLVCSSILWTFSCKGLLGGITVAKLYLTAHFVAVVRCQEKARVLRPGPYHSVPFHSAPEVWNYEWYLTILVLPSWKLRKGKSCEEPLLNACQQKCQSRKI